MTIISLIVCDLDFPSPPIYGDQEAVFASMTTVLSLLVENVKFVATIAEVTRQPSSTAWILGLAFSFSVDGLKRTALWNKGLVAILRLLCMNPSLASFNALELVYLRSKFGCGYVGIVIVLVIGCARAAVFEDWKALIWLDVHWKVSMLVGAELGLEAFMDTSVWGLQRYKLLDPPKPNAHEDF